MTRKADCTKTLEREGGGFLTGFTRRAAAALVHLREAWVIADYRNKSDVEDAIRALFSTHCLASRPETYRPILCDTLGDEQAAELWRAVVGDAA